MLILVRSVYICNTGSQDVNLNRGVNALQHVQSIKTPNVLLLKRFGVLLLSQNMKMFRLKDLNASEIQMLRTERSECFCNKANHADVYDEDLYKFSMQWQL
jgi:hypothetical protein